MIGTSSDVLRGNRDHLGRLAQRLERTVHIREVTGSNPVSPTTPG